VYKLYAYASDVEGKLTLLGTKTISVDNAHATKPFGAIDTPGQGATISGASYVNFGWALTPQPGRIPIDGSTIWVFLDGFPQGNVTYNNPRSDIDTLFPGYSNVGGAVGYRYLDTTQLTNGMHSIAWSVTDNLGRTDGVGSRFFHVLNQSGAGLSAGIEKTEGLVAKRKREMEGVRRSAEAPVEVVSYRRGYDLEARVLPVRAGGRGLLEPVELEEMERIEIHLPGASGEGTWAGALRVLGETRPLPVGSTLDEEAGRFYWQLGAGFLGEYELEFARPGTVPVSVRVRVRQKGSSDSQPE
jgi:hypothetical protein